MNYKNVFFALFFFTVKFPKEKNFFFKIAMYICILLAKQVTESFLKCWRKKFVSEIR